MTYPREIEEAFEAFGRVKEAKSLDSKVAVLRQQEDNTVMKNLLWQTYNTFRQYYIKQVPAVPAAAKAVSVETYDAFIKLLDELNDRKYKDVKAIVAEFLKGCNEEEQLWYTRVLKRNLDIGITQKGINKAWPKFIPVYDVLLAESIKDPTLTDPAVIRRLPAVFVLQYKIDGYRINLHKKDNGDVVIKTRSGLPVNGYQKLEEEAKAILPAGRVYDGEMVAPELFSWIESNMLSDNKGVIADRTLFREAARKCFSKETSKDGIFNIFDSVSMSEWDTQNGHDTYGERLSFLDGAVNPLLDDASQMTVVPTSRIFYRDNPDDIKEVVRIFHKFLSWGWEGVMIKSVESPYEWKRSKQIYKMKLMDTADLTVLDVIEGAGAGAGMVGKLVCDYKGTILNIGTGKMTAADKLLYFQNPNKIVGKTIEVAYQAESLGKNGEPVLDFARYTKIRKDK